MFPRIIISILSVYKPIVHLWQLKQQRYLQVSDSSEEQQMLLYCINIYVSCLFLHSADSNWCLVHEISHLFTFTFYNYYITGNLG